MLEDFEKFFVTLPIVEEDNCAIIYGDSRYGGWYRLNLEEAIVVRFRMLPSFTINNIIKNFTQEERLVGIHRFMSGIDLKPSLKELIEQGKLKEAADSLTDSEVSDLLETLKKTITLDCNKVPYLLIKLPICEDVHTVIKNHIENQPNYLEILSEVLEEKISPTEGSEKTNGVVCNEMVELEKEKTK